jgi:hypothetical protein
MARVPGLAARPVIGMRGAVDPTGHAAAGFYAPVPPHASRFGRMMWRATRAGKPRTEYL